MDRVFGIPYSVFRITLHVSRFTLYASLFTLFLASCAETPRITPTPATLRIATSSTLAVLIDDLGDLYRADRPWLTIQAEALNTAAAIELMNGGAVDLAFVSWLPADLDSRAWRSPLAYDAVAVIVNPANPVTGLSLAQLRDVFQGRVVDWSVLGGAGQNLIVVSREAGSGTRAAFEEAALDGRPVTLNAVVQSGSAALIEYVARTPGAIGYVSRGRVTAEVKPLPIEGVEPSPVNVVNGTYPIGRILFVVARAEPVGAAREFVRWLLDPEGQQAIGERGFGRVQ
ncbi:MAG TPA: phosphate ABC transporter substrate-binding protein [Anaerolineae bacterium]|nr:phosphate ABC transporter substrate-binding protein [Anaerolineae bacterium]